MKRKILCIDDDETISTLVEVSLNEYITHKAKSLKEAELLLNANNYSGLILDIQLPDGDGLRYLNKIYTEKKIKQIPVIILSDHTEISNKVLAFSLGAEDFIGKPFDPIELNVRLTAKIKKYESQQEDSKRREVADLVIDFNRQKTFQIQNQQELDLNLTAIEMKMLTILTQRLEQVYSRDQLMNHVWGETFISDRTIDSHIAHLRQKIQNSKLLIETVKNLGYKAAIKRSPQASI